MLSSHGNAKEYNPFHPTWPSILKRVKEESTSKGPKATVEQVSSEMGGILGASAPGQLPRNERQVTHQKRMQKGRVLNRMQLTNCLLLCNKHILRILHENLFGM